MGRARGRLHPVRPMTPDSGPVVGVVGGGQLARMMQPAAVALGVRLRVLATSSEESAAQVIPDVVLGRHDDLEALRALARTCDVVTFDHEHVPQEHLAVLADEGVVFRPGASALHYAQNKLAMRERLAQAGLPVPQWRSVADPHDAEEFASVHGWPVVLKTIRGGYDGKGVVVAHAVDEVAHALASGGEWMVEQHVAFEYEISAQVARSPHGQAVAYPVVQTVQIDGICAEVLAPAAIPSHVAQEAQRIALTVASALDVTGMLAVEMFVTGEQLSINELAMRPHNSGHWSIEGARTSQFENHLRAVLDLPLGDPSLVAQNAVMVNVLGGDYPDLHRAFLHVMAHDPGVKVHIYGKQVRPGRKVGHVTLVGTPGDGLLARARHAADFMRGIIDG